MPHKCINIHTNEEFMIRSRVQAYKGDVNVYEPLWTQTCICAVWTFSLIIPYLFFSYYFPKDFIIPYIIDNCMTDSPIITASCITSPPYILLFIPYSPVICKDNFPLVYMYKLSRYYLVFDIDLGPMFPRSTSL